MGEVHGPRLPQQTELHQRDPLPLRWPGSCPQQISGIQTYARGLPMNIGTNAVNFPIGEFSNVPTISTYKGWTQPYSGRFDPFADSYLQPQSFFPAQSSTSFGNSTRYNPSFRSWPQFNETAGLSRTFSVNERAHLEVRGEAFNILNRTWFGPLNGGATLGNPNWASGRRRRIRRARCSWWRN